MNTVSSAPAAHAMNTRLAMIFAAVLALAALAVHLLPLYTFFSAMPEPGISPVIANRDFSNYWLAGKLTMAGQQQHLFSQPVYFAIAQQVFGPEYGIHNWGYPPHTLLLLWPLGLVGYKAGMIGFLAVTFALFLFATVTFRRVVAPDASWTILILALLGYVVMMIDTAQNGFFTASLLLLGLAWMKDRPMLAGLAFAVLTIKPQLGILVPLLALFDRNWRVVLWTAVFAAALVLLSIALFGMASWHAYVTETLIYQRSVMTDWYGIFLRMMPTVFGSVRTLGFTPHAAMIAQWPVSIFGAIMVLWLLRHETDSLRRIFVLACGTFVISPYAFNYDMGALTVIAALLVGSGQPLQRYTVLSLVMVACLSGVLTNLGRSGVPISPLLLVAALIALAAENRARSIEQDALQVAAH